MLHYILTTLIIQFRDIKIYPNYKDDKMFFKFKTSFAVKTGKSSFICMKVHLNFALLFSTHFQFVTKYPKKAQKEALKTHFAGNMFFC